MNNDERPLIALPADLDDEAAAQLLDFFHESARVLEQHYAAQLHRYYQRPDPRQQPLFNDRDPPF